MRFEDVHGSVRLERKDDDATVRPAREERVGVRVELELADEGRVALQEGDQVAVRVDMER